MLSQASLAQIHRNDPRMLVATQKLLAITCQAWRCSQHVVIQVMRAEIMKRPEIGTLVD